MDLDAIKGVGPATKEKLHEAGITDVAALAEADAAEISESTGISVDRVKKFITQAQGQLAAEDTTDEDADAPVAREPVDADGTLPAGAVGDAPEPVATAANGNGSEPVKGWKVVLRDRSATARVDAGSVTYENLPIVTAKANEAEDEIMKEIGYNAVLLKEGEPAAFVRVNGHWEHDIPLFKEKTIESSGVTELVRVRVHEIRERGAAKSKAGSEGRVAGGPSEKKSGGLFGLFKKKSA